MKKLSIFSGLLFIAAAMLCVSCAETTTATEDTNAAEVLIQDGPFTFCNPLDVLIGEERSYRGGEPVVILYNDDYFLFVSHRKGYWYSNNFRDWTYVDAPNYPGGVVSVVEKDGILYGCSMNNKNVYRTTDPKSGVWEKVAELDSDRYGDANLFVDDDGRVYLYYGWSQIMPFKVVELDPTTFKVIAGPEICFFGDYKNHGFETRRNTDVIYSIFNGRRDYFEEEYPWIEGPWMTKHNGKYYLQYAAIGLELLSYSHGVYVADSPMGPFTYSEHNPLTYRTTGFQVGAGHGSTFHDKNGELWTICMIPASYGGAGRGSELAIYPTGVDKDGVMHSNYAYGDYPQYYPGIKKDVTKNNYTGWKLLSRNKKVTVSSEKEGYPAEYGDDENFLTCWSAETGEPGEFYQVDLGKVCDIYAIQSNFDHIGAVSQMPARGMGFGAPVPHPDRYQCYFIEASEDGESWTRIVDKSNNKLDLHHDYVELESPVKARFVRITNVFTHDQANFSIKDFRIFGTTDAARTTIVKDVKAVRNQADRREATLLWTPVEGADGYVIRYGIEPGKLYNSHIVYDCNSYTIQSLNTAPEYYYEVEAFDSGLDYYKEVSEEVNGIGAEIEIDKFVPGVFAYGGTSSTQRVMLKKGVNDYEFTGIDEGIWTVRHSYGPVLWQGELTKDDLIGEGVSVSADLTELGTGTQVTGMLKMKVVRGEKNGTVVITTDYNE